MSITHSDRRVRSAIDVVVEELEAQEVKIKGLETELKEADKQIEELNQSIADMQVHAMEQFTLIEKLEKDLAEAILVKTEV